MRSPVNASPRPSRATAHDSGSMWLATPSSRGTCTPYSLPVSRRTQPLPPRLAQEITGEIDRLRLVQQQIAAIEQERDESPTTCKETEKKQRAQLLLVKGIG